MYLHIRFSILISLLLLLNAAPTLAQAENQDSDQASEAQASQDDENAPEWDVSSDEHYTETAIIDTTTTTWSNVGLSPDGKTLIFDMLGDIYSVPVQGGDATALTDGIPWNYQPSFSPDGSKIAFISDRAGGDNIWVMNADGSDPKPVTSEKENIVYNPGWSPDGQYLVGRKGFYSTRSIMAGEIWMFHSSGGNGVNLVERPFGVNDQKNRAEPAFSPDGQYVYYSADVTEGRVWQYNKNALDPNFAIQRLNLETGETHTIVSGPGGAIRPTPSPDGKSLAYIKRRIGLVSQIWLKDLESGVEKLLFDGFERDHQESSGSEGNAPAIDWSSDGRSIAFWTAGKFHLLDVASGEVREIPVRVQASKKMRPALRHKVTMYEDEFDVQSIRWAQHTPDGGQIVFQALGYLWLRNAAGGEPKRLTGQNDHYEFYPSVSPDGRSIVYVTFDDADLGSVRTIGLNGRGGRTLSDEPGHYINPSYSADGSRVVFEKIAGGSLSSPTWSMNTGIYTVAADGESAPSMVLDTGSDAHFSADGSRIFYTTLAGERGTDRVLNSVNLAGNDHREHLQSEKSVRFRVSPDGQWVAFIENQRTHVAAFFASGKKITLSGKTEEFPVRQLAGRSGEFLSWSADSRALDWSMGRYLYHRDLNQAFAFLQGAPEELPEPETEGTDLAFKQASDRPDGVIAVTGGRVVTMRDADNTQEVIENGVVLIEGNRITAVGAADAVDVPGHAHVIDARGKTVLPGLVDAHAHGSMANEELTPQQNWMQLSNLAFGVTTIHDPSNDTSEFFAAAELQKTGQLVAPRVYGTGRILYGAYSPGSSAETDSLEDARFHVQRLKDSGGISVKSYNQPRRDQRQQIIQAASEIGMMVVPEGGLRFQFNMNMVVDGHTTIEHSVPVQNVYDDVIQLWSQSGTAYTPTFVVSYGGLSGEEYWYDRTEVWKNERLLRYTPKGLVYPRSVRRPTAPDSEYNHPFVVAGAKQLRDQGVRVNIGAHGQREGLGAHWEIWHMAMDGFSQWEALRGATIDGAMSLGMEHDVGSLEAGKLADLFIVDGNPLEDIFRSEYVSHTVINGRVYEAATMNQVYPDPVAREALFFEREGGDAWSVQQAEAAEAKARALNWRH